MFFQTTWILDIYSRKMQMTIYFNIDIIFTSDNNLIDNWSEFELRNNDFELGIQKFPLGFRI